MNVDIILEYLWLAIMDPEITFCEGTWRYRIDKDKIEIVSAKKFKKLLKPGARVFGILMLPASWPPGINKLTCDKESNPKEIPK